MANTYTLPGVLLTGTHASRPAANTVANGTVYSETDTGLLFQSNASSWSAWGPAASGGNATPGYEIDYVELTSPNNSVTATTEATANTIVTASAIAYDGSTVVVIAFYAPYCRPDTSTTGQFIRLVLYDGASSIGFLCLIGGTTGVEPSNAPVYVTRRLTPSNATHTYSVRAYVNAGTGIVGAGAGGAAAYMPAFIRTTRV